MLAYLSLSCTFRLYLYLKYVSCENNPINSCNKNNKIPGINLTKEVQDLYSKNYTTLIKEIEVDTNGEMVPAHGLEEPILLNVYSLPKASYRFSAIPSKIQIAFFAELEQSPQICTVPQKTTKSQSTLEKEQQRWRYQNGRFPDHLESCNKTVWYWHRDQRNRREPRNKPN